MKGPKHKTKFKVGDRINDKFTLLSNFCRKTTIKGKNEWLWECKCDCGEVFTSREHKLTTRFGCQSCTNKKTSAETALKKSNGVTHVGLKNRLFKEYKAGACKRGLEFDLTFEQFISLIEGNCVYCGEAPRIYEYQKQYMQRAHEPWCHNGVDRVDTTKGYTIDNCVSCCTSCNYAKHMMSVDEYKAFITKVYNHLILVSSTTIPKGSTSQANGDGNGEHPIKDEDIV